MSKRQDICRGALYESQWGSWKPSAWEMKHMFECVGLQPPSASELDRFSSATSNISVNGRSISWCGIFACYVLKEYGKLDVKWVSGKGITGKGFNKVWDHRNIKAGDVAVVAGKLNRRGQRLHHQFVVTYANYATNEMHSVDGNSVGNSIVWHTNKKIFYPPSERTEKQPYCYYSIVA